MNTGQNEIVLGVLGGMGTYATIHFFQKYAEIFPAQKEWERPRIIIDNNCTMPSRVRAILYGEDRRTLVLKIAESIRNLISCGATHIILACNTSHVFLDEVYQIIPEAKNYIIDIIDVCANKIRQDGIDEVFLLATEGTILSNIYDRKFSGPGGIRCKTPSEDEFAALRKCIEAVKQNMFTHEILDLFQSFLYRKKVCVLGCTELPVLYEMCPKEGHDVKVYEPLELTLKMIHEEFKKITG